MKLSATLRFKAKFFIAAAIGSYMLALPALAQQANSVKTYVALNTAGSDYRYVPQDASTGIATGRRTHPTRPNKF